MVRKGSYVRLSAFVKRKGIFLKTSPVFQDGAGDEIRTHDSLLGKQTHQAKLLNKLSVSQLAQLSKLSKAYISQVKHGKRPPSEKLLEAIREFSAPREPQKDHLALFLRSREAMGVSPRTLGFYEDRLGKFVAQVNYPEASRQQIEHYLNSIPPNHNGLATRHASFRAMKTFYRWLHVEYGLRNPMMGLSATILGKPILPTHERDQVLYLIEQAHNARDKAVIALFTESGLRLSELVNVGFRDIDWKNRTIKVLGKNRKEAYAPFGSLSEEYLAQWLSEYKPDGNIWGLSKLGIISMLSRLEKATGLPCNPHTFRRTFACLLRKAGVDTMTIKDLGRWESLEMVQRYTRSVTFEDCMKHYRAPLG